MKIPGPWGIHISEDPGPFGRRTPSTPKTINFHFLGAHGAQEGFGPGILTYMGPPWARDPHLYGYHLGPGPGILTYMGPPLGPGSLLIWVPSVNPKMGFQTGF